MCLNICYIDRVRSKENLEKQKQIAWLKDTKNVFNLENNVTYFYSGFNTFMNS